MRKTRFLSSKEILLICTQKASINIIFVNTFDKKKKIWWNRGVINTNNMLNVITMWIFESWTFWILIGIGLWILIIQILFWACLFFDFAKNHWKAIVVTTCIYILFILLLFITKNWIQNEVKYGPWMEWKSFLWIQKEIQ